MINLDKYILPLPFKSIVNSLNYKFFKSVYLVFGNLISVAYFKGSFIKDFKNINSMI